MYDIIIYLDIIFQIGGIETFLYQLAKNYPDKNITLMYRKCDKLQLERLKTVYKNIIEYKGQDLKCNKIIINQEHDYWILPHIDAKEYIRIIHGDYRSLLYFPIIPEQLKTIEIEGKQENYSFKKPIKYYGVSQRACASYNILTNKPITLCYNPIMIEQPKKILHLISATRLTEEKGKGRMIELAKQLDEAKIPYLWTVFTNDIEEISNPNIVYVKPRFDIINYIADADYLVQLSDSEACPYVLLEALSVGTPVIVTKFPAAKELGVNETNGFLLNFDMTDVPIEEIYNKTFNFKWKPPKNIWDKILS